MFRHVTSAFSGLVITVTPSSPTSSSVYSMPFFLQTLASSASIGRDASAMSISPLQKSSKPSPVPGPSTLMATSGFVSLKISATTDEIGSTVDEPEIVIEPDRSPASGRARVARAAVVVVAAARGRDERECEHGREHARVSAELPHRTPPQGCLDGREPRQAGWTHDCAK